MLRIVLRPREQVEQAWREWDQEKAHARQAADKPSVVMADEAAALLDHRDLIFRGRPYRVPPIGFDDGAVLIAIQDRLRAYPAATGPKALIREFMAVVTLARKLVRPVGFFRRLLWPLTPNPFRKATPREVGALMGFFSACLVRDGVSSKPKTPSRGTFSRISPGSSIAIPRGSDQMATHSLGVIS